MSPYESWTCPLCQGPAMGPVHLCYGTRRRAALWRRVVRYLVDRIRGPGPQIRFRDDLLKEPKR